MASMSRVAFLSPESETPDHSCVALALVALDTRHESGDPASRTRTELPRWRTVAGMLVPVHQFCVVRCHRISLSHVLSRAATPHRHAVEHSLIRTLRPRTRQTGHGT